MRISDWSSDVCSSDLLDQRQAANVRIIERAVPPTEGSNRQPLIILLGLVGGAATALAAGFVRDFSRTTIATPEAAERALGLPVLVAVGQDRKSTRLNSSH